MTTMLRGMSCLGSGMLCKECPSSYHVLGSSNLYHIV